MTPLRPRDLRTKIEIMRNADTDNGKGGYTSTWSPLASPFAEVLGQDGREAVIAEALQGNSTYRIRFWFRDDLKDSDQIRLGGSGGIDLNILSATDPFGTRREIMVIASTGSASPTS